MSSAIITGWWNGEVVHDKWNMADRTLAGDLEGPAAGPLRFQGYGDPVFYRNIRLVEGSASVKPRVRKSLGWEDLDDNGRSFGISRADGRSVASAFNRSGPPIEGSESDFHAPPASGFYFIPGPDGIRGEYVFKGRNL